MGTRANEGKQSNRDTRLQFEKPQFNKKRHGNVSKAIHKEH